MTIKERSLPENTHKACSGHCRQPARVHQGTLKIRRVLPSKSKFTSSFWQTEKFATVKIRVWRFWTHFPIVLKWPSKKMFCWLIFVHVFTFIFRCSSKKLFCWLIFVHVFTLTISLKGAQFTCTIHLHYALTLNTYTMHYTLTQETLQEAEISFKRSYKLSFNLDTYIIHYASGDFLNWF